MKLSLRQYYLLTLALLLAPAMCEPKTAAADKDTVVQSSSGVCTSLYIKDGKEHFGFLGIRSPYDFEQHCPKNHAYMAVYPAGGSRREASKIPVWGNCCPVPKDALLDEHSYTQDYCPRDSVATGATQEFGPYMLVPSSKHPKHYLNTRNQFLRCTKINTKNYRLADTRPGIRVGATSHFCTFFDPTSTRASIPPALRYGLGRMMKYRWSSGFCVGRSWGDILVGKTTKYCDGLHFAKLKRLENEQPTGMQLYPDCLAVLDYDTADPKCIQEEASP